MGGVTRITLKEDEREYLESIVRTRKSSPQMVQKAKVLLLKNKGVPLAIISDISGLSRSKVSYALKKYLDGGVEYALCDTFKRTTNNGYSAEEKAWICNLVCQGPNSVRISEQIWSCTRLTQYLNENAEEAGYPRLANISYTTVLTILKQSGIHPQSLRCSRYLFRGSSDSDASNI